MVNSAPNQIWSNLTTILTTIWSIFVHILVYLTILWSSNSDQHWFGADLVKFDQIMVKFDQSFFRVYGRCLTNTFRLTSRQKTGHLKGRGLFKENTRLIRPAKKNSIHAFGDVTIE